MATKPPAPPVESPVPAAPDPWAKYHQHCEALRLMAQDYPQLAPVLDRLLPRLFPCKHGLGWRNLNWFGKVFAFTANQSLVVEPLWKGWRRGLPDISHEDLKAYARIKALRLRDVFKGHPAWGTLIVRGSARGTLRLAEPGYVPPGLSPTEAVEEESDE